MKKILTVLFVAFLFAGTFSMSSCKKCTTCTYTYEGFDGTETYSYPELCGNNDEIDNYKAACADAAALVAGTCDCVDD